MNGPTSLHRSFSTVTNDKPPSVSPSVSPPTVDGLTLPFALSNDSRSATLAYLSRYDLTSPSHPTSTRRGSLPIIGCSASDHSHYGIQPTFDPLARRGPPDMDVTKLAPRPYAHLTASNNGKVYNLYAGPESESDIVVHNTTSVRSSLHTPSHSDHLP